MKHLRIDTQYKKLKEIALSASKFIWNGGDAYLGPVNPKGIIIHTDCGHHTISYWFVLAENVSPEYLDEIWDGESPAGVILVRLDQNFEFTEWDTTTKTLGYINGNSSPDGTIMGLYEHFANNPNARISMTPLFFERQGNAFTSLLLLKRNNFDISQD
jgi:hypothetical protein